MQEYINFFYKHWELSLAFIGVLAALIVTELKKSADSNGISPQQAVDLINHHQATVIDLHSADLYKTGHIIGAINIPLDELDVKLKKFTKSTKKPVILVCADGKGAQKSLAKFVAEGFNDPLYLAGGLLSWANEGLPLTRE